MSLDLEAIEQRLAKATQEPTSKQYLIGGKFISQPVDVLGAIVPDLRPDVAALLSELKSLRAENARLREALATAASDLDETAIAVQQLMTDGRPSHAAATIRACSDRAASVLIGLKP